MKTKLLVICVLSLGLVLVLSVLSSKANKSKPAQIESSVAVQQQAQNVQVVGQLGGTVRAIAVQGSLAYIGVGPRLVVMDVSDLAHPAVSGQSAVLPDIIEHVTVSGALAYVADGDSGLYIVNVSNPVAPAEVGSYDTPGRAYDVVVNGSYAYVADGSNGLYILNVSDPAAPSEVGFYDTPSSTHNVAIAGAHIFLAAYHSGLQIYENLLTSVSETKQNTPVMHGIQLLQNPVVNDRINLRLHIPYKTSLSFSLCNVIGQAVQTQAKSYYDAGVYDMVIPVNTLPAGVYFLTLKGLPQYRTIKVIITR